MKIIRSTILGGLALLAVAATAGVASAATGYVTSTVNQRQGPGTQYPVVNSIPGGVTVIVDGCLSGGSWCDVTFAGRRGWVSGRYVEGAYQSRRVAVPEYIPELGIPTVTFGIDTGIYGGGSRHYRHHRYYYGSGNPPGIGHKPPHMPGHKPPHMPGYKPPHLHGPATPGGKNPGLSGPDGTNAQGQHCVLNNGKRFCDQN